MAKTKRTDLRKVTVNVHDGLYERAIVISETTGQTLSSVLQMAIAIGVGNLEPAVLGSVQTQVRTNNSMVDMLGSFMDDMSEEVGNATENMGKITKGLEEIEQGKND